MIIKIIPETDDEKDAFLKNGLDSIEHYGVREYMMFGNKIEEDSILTDFHEWQGSHQYLIGSLHYFYEVIKNKDPDTAKAPLEVVASIEPSNQMPEGLIKRGSVMTDIQELDISGLTDQSLNLMVQETVEKLDNPDIEAVDNSQGLRIVE